MELKRVVVTGIGALTPIGNTAPETWNNLLKGVSGAGPITLFDASEHKTRFACEVKFDVDGYFDRREGRRMDRYAKMGIISSDEAVRDSGIDSDAISKNRVGVIFGSGIGGTHSFQTQIEDFAARNRSPKFNPFFIPKMIADMAAGLISMKYGFMGPNYAIVSACATSTHCINDAANYIRLGKADAMICGGSEASVTEAGVGGFNAMQALSTRNDNPKEASRPFDKDRDGFVIGEGSASLVIEELEHALRRGAKIYAEIAGTGATADAYHMTAPHPDGLGAIEVMKAALNDFEPLKPEDIDYINVHGTSTSLGDVAELKAINKVFGEHAYKLNISSTKSMTGHLLGAAGALEGIASILAIINDIVPPTINHFSDDPEIDPKLNLTFGEAQKRTVNYALSNTFGFGGHNASVIFKKFRS
ncbi:MAG TPA: beta-ketoacyl-[acyl-carrier-protein] synthase II [Flavobacteriales bacterium]|jgi:3-oxoacyl-[acyl-carrier-protein] synthase II|nr:beta-ketoacyl-[acyl-carrier-protein] synthase II [Flavobacteriales bacterium]